ncbi:MAG: hypothetical protein AVDCRST_MAG18-1291, partial [uncultured Thermomicrobiales bacterium]
GRTRRAWWLGDVGDGGRRSATRWCREGDRPATGAARRVGVAHGCVSQAFGGLRRGV